MKWDELVRQFQDLPVIDSKVFSLGGEDPSAVKVQLSRWQKKGKLIQLKRGLYLLSQEYRKTDAYEPYIASILKKPSYISLEKALEFYGLIPEGVPVYTSVTTKRARKFISKIAVFDYRHIKSSLFWGYRSITMNKQTGFVALPEKALLDLVYFKRKGLSASYLEELRLQNLEQIDISTLLELAPRYKKPGMLRAAGMIKKYIEARSGEEKML
jgi:predicted transcriptional regulator of viral defense system